MSKLYTEEQVNELRKALGDIAQWNDDLEDDWEDAGNRAMDALKCFEKTTPIELPTDEEIWDESVEIYPYPNPITVGLEVGTSMKRSYFTVGAKWMRDKIKGGEK